MKGEQIREGFINAYLIRNGAAPGSSLQMIKNAFTTEQCWLDMTPKLLEGYRSMSFFFWNPQWWAVAILMDLAPISATIMPDGMGCVMTYAFCIVILYFN